MSLDIHRWLVTALLATAAFASWAQPSNNKDERKAAVAAAEAAQVAGPAEVELRNQATLKLPAGYVYVPIPAAARLMQSWGNRTTDRLVGVVVPKGGMRGQSWVGVIKYFGEGYIKDDDAKDWNADDLLKSLKEGTEAANEERVKRGIAPLQVTGWAEKPRYDATNHRLVWSIAISPKNSSASDDVTVNYNTYALGREGYISLNLITDMKDLDHYKPFALELLGALQYKDGKKYADFNNSTDKVAAYGLAALVAGVAAKKLGLLAIAFAFLAKFAKIAILAAAGAFWGVVKLFKKKQPNPS